MATTIAHIIGTVIGYTIARFYIVAFIIAALIFVAIGIIWLLGLIFGTNVPYYHNTIYYIDDDFFY